MLGMEDTIPSEQRRIIIELVPVVFGCALVALDHLEGVVDPDLDHCIVAVRQATAVLIGTSFRLLDYDVAL